MRRTFERDDRVTSYLISFMKKLLSISILVNLSLLTLVIFLVADRRKTNVEFGLASVAERIRPAEELSSTTPPILSPVKAESFSWSDLEATDYRIYIANLRGIGCPEQTIRDIIAADLDANVYSELRKPFERKRVALDASPASEGERHALEADLQRLNIEESTTIAALLGPRDSLNQTATDASLNSQPLRRQPRETPAALPLVLRDVDLSALSLNTRQIQLIANLRQKFVEEIGGSGQDPNDPNYRARWQQAEASANDHLKAILGLSAYQAFEFRAQKAAKNN
jgi:hypothetical protein